MILTTDRLRLEPLKVTDGALVYPLMSDVDVMAHWDVGEIDDPDVVDLIVRNQVDEMATGKVLYWTLHTLDGTFVGVGDLLDIDERHHRAEIGFMITMAARGQGYAREAVAAILAHAAKMGLRRISARTHVGNHHSEALLEHLGFQDEGMMRGYVLRDGERRDCRVWGLLL